MADDLDIEDIIDDVADEEDMQKCMKSIIDWEEQNIEELNEPKQRRNREKNIDKRIEEYLKE